jgi:uncharacterized protein YkwD
MFWALLLSLAIFPPDAPAPARLPAPNPVRAQLIAAYLDNQPSYDSQAEQSLLELANRARKRAGLPPFQSDDGLARAAREHATAMAMRQELSHQFPGEASLPQRLAENCKLYLVEAAENVASAGSPDVAHDSLMRSPAHRENLLHPSYNTIGIGVVRRGDTLYVAQDFGHSLPAYSAQKAEDVLAGSVSRARADAHLSPLRREDGSAAQGDACVMSARDSVQAATPASARYLLRYTTTQPEVLPPTASQAISDTNLKSFAAGSCFARSKTYPNGIYWIVLRMN